MWYRWSGFRATCSGRRSVAIVLVASFIYSILLSSVGLVADPRFREFQERGRPEAEKYINRANRLTEEQSWTNYVETGVAHEQALWEAEALEEIRKELRQQEEAEVNKADREANRDRYYADFDAARLKWEEQASDYIEEERGGFKARLAVQEFKEETAATEADRIKAFTVLIKEAQVATAATASLDLALWDSVVDPERASLAATFYGSMDTMLDGIRSNKGTMSAKEQAAFEAELDRLEGEIFWEDN